MLRTIAGTSLAWPVNSSMFRGLFPPAHRIKRKVFQAALSADAPQQVRNVIAQNSLYRLKLCSRNTFIDAPADVEEEAQGESLEKGARKRADSWPPVATWGQQEGSNYLAKALAAATPWALPQLTSSSTFGRDVGLRTPVTVGGSSASDAAPHGQSDPQLLASPAAVVADAAASGALAPPPLPPGEVWRRLDEPDLESPMFVPMPAEMAAEDGEEALRLPPPAHASASSSRPCDFILPWLRPADVSGLGAACRKLRGWSLYRVPSLARAAPGASSQGAAAATAAAGAAVPEVVAEAPHTREEGRSAEKGTTATNARKQFPFRPKRVYLPRSANR